MRVLRACLALLLLSPSTRGAVEEDWQYIVSLDAGPRKKPASGEEALLLARNQLLIQRKAIEQFLVRHPQNDHVFDAKLKLARILAAEGKMDNDPRRVDEALRLFENLESTPGLPSERLAEAGFARVSLAMQGQEGSSQRARESIVWSARSFVTKYPGDRRGPRLLVEAATVCDDVPDQKRELLEEAARLTTEEPLKRRIADDLRRLDLIGKPLSLKLSARPGGELDLAKLRGYVVVLVFWSADSPHSLLWLRDFRTSWESLPKDQVRVVTVSLDDNQATLESRLRALHSDWPTHFDGMGWHSPVARSLGINALPSVWILDQKGILRTINARSTYETWIRQLLREERAP